MQFVVTGYDGSDDKALERRMAAREAHIALSDEAIKRGEQIMAAALTNAEGQMIGSVMIVDFPSREALDQWLEKEPYVVGKVWEKVDVKPCKVGPSFQHLILKK